MPWEAQKARSKRMAPGRPSGASKRQKFLADEDDEQDEEEAGSQDGVTGIDTII